MKEGEPLKVLSLFSGVGGFDMGLTNTGKMTTAFMCEIDKHARSVLDYHWPDVPKWDDVTTLTGAYILEKTGGVDVVAWGSPCQDLSIAGKRAGLTGERSGLFHHGIRIIKELRELSNGKYPTWSIWENVAGALSSNKGADFGEVLYEMDEAGACFSEWSLLDAQYFGVPQRRRRVFVTSCFDSSVSEGCPEPLLPVAQSLPGDSASRSKKGQGVTGASSDSVGAGSQLATGKDIANTISASLYHKSTVVNQDVNNGHLVVDIVGSLQARDYKGVGNQYVSENKVVVQYAVAHTTQPLTFTKSRRAQTVDDHETWVESDVAPTLNIFDVGDIRATTAIVEQPLAFDTQFGSNANVFENQSPTLKSSQQPPSVTQYVAENKLVVQNAVTQPVLMRQREGKPGGGKGPLLSENISLTLSGGNDQILFADAPLLLDGRRVDDVRVYTEPVQTLQERMGTGGNNVPVVASGHPEMIVRRLTPLECTRLMGWRDDHLEIGTLDAKDQDYARQVVRHLWRNLQSETLQRDTRGFWSVLTPEVLLSSVFLGWVSWDMAGKCAARAREIQGENAWPENFLHRLWGYKKFGSSPHRREPFEQLAAELGRPLSFMPYTETQETQGLFYLRVYESAQGTGFLQQALDSLEEMGKPFVYQEQVANISDTQRYKMCGNGVASPVAQWIGEHIARASGRG